MIVVGRVGGDEGSQDAMTGNRQRLGEKIRDIADAPDEDDTKVSLADPVPDPMQAHVGVDTSATSTKQCEAITNVAIRIMRVKGMDEQRKIKIDCVII